MNESLCEVCENIIKEKYGSGRFCNFNCKQRFISLNNREEKNKKVAKKLTKPLIDIETTCENCDQKFVCTIKLNSSPKRFCAIKCSRSFSTKHARKQINKKVSNTLTDKVGWSRGKKLEKKFEAKCQKCNEIFFAVRSYKKFCDKHPAGKDMPLDISNLSEEQRESFELRQKRSMKRALNLPIKMSEERRKHLSDVMKRKVSEFPESFLGGNRGKVKTFIIDGIKLLGMWEVTFYQWAKEKGLNPQRCKNSFPYEWNGIRSYFPDFYLPTLDVYIEVKGFETDRDKAKWVNFPKKLIIIKKNEINQIRKLTYEINHNIHSASGTSRT